MYAGTQLEDEASLPSMVLRAYFIFFLPLILPSHSEEEEEEGETEGYICGISVFSGFFCWGCQVATGNRFCKIVSPNVFSNAQANDNSKKNP